MKKMLACTSTWGEEAEKKSFKHFLIWIEIFFSIEHVLYLKNHYLKHEVLFFAFYGT